MKYIIIPDSGILNHERTCAEHEYSTKYRKKNKNKLAEKVNMTVFFNNYQLDAYLI